MLVRFRKILNEKDILLLGVYRKQSMAAIYRDAPRIVFTILVMVVFYNLVLANILMNGSRKEPPYRFLLSLLLMTVLLFKGYLVFNALSDIRPPLLPASDAEYLSESHKDHCCGHHAGRRHAGQPFHRTRF